MTTTRGAAASRTPLLLAAGVAGVLCFVAGQAMLPVLGDDVGTAFARMIATRDQLMASRLLSAAGAFGLLALVGPFRTAAPVCGRRAMTVGVALLAVGTFFNGLSQVVQGYATWATTAPGIDAGAAMPVLLELDAGLVGLPISYWSVPLFGLGVVVVGVALLLARSVPRWMPVTLLLGAVLAFATAGTGPLVALTAAPLAVGLLAPVLHLDRRRTETLVAAAPKVHAERP